MPGEAALLPVRLRLASGGIATPYCFPNQYSHNTSTEIGGRSGTPPNAIVFSTGRIPSGEMARRGLLLNILGVPILTAGTYLLIRPVMGIP